MGYKNLLAIIGMLIVGAGIVMAISGATPTWVSESRWTGNAAGSDVTRGGNLTVVNVAATVLTKKWAAYNGNVSGTIILGDSSANLYTWAWSDGAGGEVCVSPNATFNFTSAATATGLNIDTAWGFTGTQPDSGNNTYKTSNCNLNFTEAAVTNTGNVTLQGNSTFNSCVIRSDTIAAGTTGFVAFCTAIQPTTTGRNYKNDPVNYELMVATNNTVGATETYYFYAELD